MRRGVTSASGLKGHELDAGRRAPLGGLDAVVSLESPIIGVARERDDQNMSAILARGCRVIMSGEGGDQFLDEMGYLADLLYRAKPIRFVRETSALADWYGGDSRELAQVAATCLVPSWAKYWGKRLLRGVPPPWMCRQTARAGDGSLRWEGLVVDRARPLACGLLGLRLRDADHRRKIMNDRTRSPRQEAVPAPLRRYGDLRTLTRGGLRRNDESNKLAGPKTRLVGGPG